MSGLDDFREEYRLAQPGDAIFIGAISPEEFFAGVEPEKLPPLSGPVTMEDGTVIEPRANRGSVLQEAMFTINGERQDVYGSPEDSFELIADYWCTYLRSLAAKRNREAGIEEYFIPPIFKEDIAMMMTLFKIAREANQHKRDNIVDAAGYLGIYADMQVEG